MKTYHSKVLLFGEYSVILNSMALAVNYPLFDGQLVFGRGSEGDSEGAISSGRELKAFGQYIKDYLNACALGQEKALFSFDMGSFEFDLEHGLFFSSSIPQGYGVGSSAAVCASIFERYGKMATDKERLDGSAYILELRKIFARLESYFHGQSSGLDPLISYLGSSILIRSSEDISVVSVPKFKNEKSAKGSIFLVSTGHPHKTGPLVNLFLDKCKNPDFLKLCQEELLPVTNRLIHLFLEADMEGLYEQMKILSAFQLEHFAPMIPTEFKGLWKTGLKTDRYLFKLCGAGGGGFLLGMSKDFSSLKLGHQVRSLFSF